MEYDFCVIGGGIIGASVAMHLLSLRPGSSLILIEKEKVACTHQTGHNSGVMHAGIYYPQDSFKAKLCREGLVAGKSFCQLHSIPFEECGKLIVATNDIEKERIDALYDRAMNNGARIERINTADLKLMEPHIHGVAALRSPDTAIVDYTAICRKMLDITIEKGGVVSFNNNVVKISEHANYVTIDSETDSLKSKKLVVCAGLQSDRMALLAGLDIDFKIVPFRGEYYRLTENKQHITKHLIYPAPDPSLPFLGVHITRMIDGSITVGPNAVISFSREGYKKGSFSLQDSLDFTMYPGFWKLISRHGKYVVHELKVSLSKAVYLEECRKYCPSLELTDLTSYPAGIRAQAVSKDGIAIHDFMFKETARMLHVCNAPSPAATSAIPIGNMIAKRCVALHL
jgi:L-2-hydroxyglutarate oxidase